MLTDYPPKDSDIFTKECQSRVDHGIIFYATTENDEIYKVQIPFPVKPPDNIIKTATFVYTFKQLWISPGSLFIPYFEPDLSNYQELINKLKTYILLS